MVDIKLWGVVGMTLAENARGSGGRTPTSCAFVTPHDANGQVSIIERC